MTEFMVGVILGMTFVMVCREPVALAQEFEIGQVVCEKNAGLSSIRYHAFGVIDEFRCADGAVFEPKRVRGERP